MVYNAHVSSGMIMIIISHFNSYRICIDRCRSHFLLQEELVVFINNELICDIMEKKDGNGQPSHSMPCCGLKWLRSIALAKLTVATPFEWHNYKNRKIVTHVMASLATAIWPSSCKLTQPKHQNLMYMKFN